MQVIRFKLETIKITIQNKKDNPSLSKPRRAHLAHPTPWQVGEGQVVLLPGTQQGPGAVESQQQSPEGRPGAEAGRARGLHGAGSRSGAAGSSRALGFQVSARWTGLALEIYCTVLEEAWARGRAGAAGEAGGGRAGGGHRLVLASSRIFQITRCMQALASSLELCPSTVEGAEVRVGPAPPRPARSTGPGPPGPPHRCPG